MFQIINCFCSVMFNLIKIQWKRISQCIIFEVVRILCELMLNFDHFGSLTITWSVWDQWTILSWFGSLKPSFNIILLIAFSLIKFNTSKSAWSRLKTKTSALSFRITELKRLHSRSYTSTFTTSIDRLFIVELSDVKQNQYSLYVVRMVEAKWNSFITHYNDIWALFGIKSGNTYDNVSCIINKLH